LRVRETCVVVSERMYSPVIHVHPRVTGPNGWLCTYTACTIMFAADPKSQFENSREIERERKGRMTHEFCTMLVMILLLTLSGEGSRVSGKSSNMILGSSSRKIRAGLRSLVWLK